MADVSMEIVDGQAPEWGRISASERSEACIEWLRSRRLLTLEEADKATARLKVGTLDPARFPSAFDPGADFTPFGRAVDRVRPARLDKGRRHRQPQHPPRPKRLAALESSASSARLPDRTGFDPSIKPPWIT